MKLYTYNICKHDFYDTAVADILRAIDGGAIFGSLILSCCCIDYMGAALNIHNKNTSDDFKRFINDYMGIVNTKYKEENIQNCIYAIRNSLVHVYGESDASKRLNLDFTIEHFNELGHLSVNTVNTRKVIKIYLPHFIAELISGIEYFFRSNLSNETLLKEWYRKLVIIQGVGAGLKRIGAITNPTLNLKYSHRYLDILDKIPEESEITIMKYISSNIHTKLNSIRVE